MCECVKNQDQEGNQVRVGLDQVRYKLTYILILKFPIWGLKNLFRVQDQVRK